MCHVLVIEDEPLIADVICDFLTAEGATSVDVASTETEACRLAMEHPPAVITSDVRLAEGWGPMAVRTIRSIHGELPTIFITALPHECEPCDHAIAILAKPFGYDDLAAAFARARAISPNA